MKMDECANCKNPVAIGKSNLFTQPLPLLITLYDEEGVSTREKGEVSIYEALIDVFSLRSNPNSIRLLESGMNRSAERESETEGEREKCMLSLCHECAYRLANLYELCQEFTQLSVKAHSFLYPIIAKVTVKAELLEDTVEPEEKSELSPSVPAEDDDNGNAEDGVEVIGEVPPVNKKPIIRKKEEGKNENGRETGSNEEGIGQDGDGDEQFYPLSPESNQDDDDSDSGGEEGCVADRVRRRMEKLALRKAAGGDINALLEVTNDPGDWLSSSSDSGEDEIDTSDESYVEDSEPEVKRKRGRPPKIRKDVEGNETGVDADGNLEDSSTTPRRRNRVKEKLTCTKCGQQYVNRACFEKHMRRHKSKYRRIRKGPAKYLSIKEERVAGQGDGEDGEDNPLQEQSGSENGNGSGENNYASDDSGEDEIIGGRLRKRWRITDEGEGDDDEWNPKKKRPYRRNPSAPHEYEEKVRVPCTVCGNSFMSHGHLIQHMKTHTKPKNACILCGKEYRYPSELKVHLESHQRMKEKRMNAGKLKMSSSQSGENIDRFLNSEFSDDGEVPSPLPTGESANNDESTESGVNSSELQDGQQKVDISQIVTCTVCRKHFRHPHFLQMHMHSHSKAMKCTQCPEVFTTPKDLREHKIAHRLERRATIEPMSCKYCGKQYYDETHLFRHQESHELPPPMFPCEICGKSFTRKQKLKLHIDTVHTTERPYRCHLCPLAYSRKDKLNAHITKAHGEELKCELCGKCFIGEASLKIHVVKHAFEAPREFQCEQCGRKYQQMKHLKNHIKFMHRKRTANVCQTCGKTFGRASCLKKHEISHQQIGSHLCSQCGKAYKHERSLILHEQKEHLGESSYQYECTVCSKRFHRKELLQSHQVTENHMVAGSTLPPTMPLPLPLLLPTDPIDQPPDSLDLREVQQQPQQSQQQQQPQQQSQQLPVPMPLPEHFLQLSTPSGMSDMLNIPLDNHNPLDLMHAATANATTDQDKYRSSLSAISEGAMFVAQNF